MLGEADCHRSSRVAPAYKQAALLHAEANSIRFNDPEFSSRCSVRQRQDEPLHEPQNHAYVLPLGPEDNVPSCCEGG